ncbi:TPA: hypothetical protein GXZ54_04130 [bacterium]|nr:hypothetical protein [bacterium]
MLFESRRHLRNCPFLWLFPVILLENYVNKNTERTIILVLLLIVTIFQWIKNDAFYYFTNEVLVAKGNFRFRKIPLKAIKKIQVKKNVFLKNNKELNTYQIIYDNKKIIVSPLDSQGFLTVFKEKTGIELT